MTVTTSTNKRTYTGDASTTAFAYNFKILASTDLKVYTRLIASPYTETLQTETTHYSVSGVGAAGGGTVTMVSAPAATLQLIIVRAVPQTQLTDYTANDAFPADTHEEALDRLAMVVQDQQEVLDRALKVSKTVTDLTTPEFKEPAAARADKFLAFDADGDELTVTDGPIPGTEIDSVADAHVLIYDNSDSRWENKAVSGDIAITSAGVASIASGVIVNADVHASAGIVDSKLATISTADKVSGAAIQVDGAADGTGITIADTDKLLVDDGGTTKFVNASQLNSYVSAAVAADDVGTGDAAASFETSSGAVVVDSQASTTTIDGHTGVTVQSSSSGDILLDSAADVVLDAAGNDVIFKASGTAIGTLTNSSSDLVITANVEDKDILFKGDDGGSAVTALSLDMSDAGKATFSGGLALGDDQALSFGAAPDLTIEYDEDGIDTTRVVAANGLTLSPHGTSSGNTTELRFLELAANGNNYAGFKAADSITGTSVYTLPAAYPASNKILQSTDAGVLTWETASSGGASLSNDGNNRVVTADGSGGINGEANLTFDGSQLTVPDGTVSAPPITNVGDLNTGVYFPAADTVGVVTGGTEQFRFGSNPIPGGSSKNLVHNGNANVAQRGTVTGLGGVNYVYGVDGWASYVQSSGARYTMSQDTGPGAAYDAVSNNSVKIDITTADTASTSALVSAVIQKIEGQNCQHLRWGNAGALELTLSFWVKSSKTGTHTVALWVNDGNRGCPNNYTVDSADTWQKISVTFPGDPSGTFPPDDNTQYLFVVFPIHTGATYEGTNATWASGEIYATSSTVNIADNTDNNFWFTDVQLEVGSVATSFAYEDYGTTLSRCQRYYTIWTGASTLGMSGVCRSASTGALSGLNFPVEMRAAPTMTYTTVNCVDSSAGGVDGTLSTSAAGTKSVTCALGSASGFTDGNGLFVEIKAGDGITASAEL